MELKFKEKMYLSGPEKVLECIEKLWNQFPEYDKGRENMFCLYLNVKNALICAELTAQGTIDSAIIYPREVIRKALIVNSAGIILIHNHPSGDSTPSADDKKLTARIKEAAKFFDITLLDHVIIGEGSHYSFQYNGIL